MSAFRAALSEYIGSTSVGGLSQLNLSSRVALKVVWVLIFLGGLGVTAFNVTTITFNYFKYPSQKSAVACSPYSSLGAVQSNYQRALKLYMYRQRNSSRPLSRNLVRKLLGNLDRPVCRNATADPTSTQRGKRRRRQAPLLPGTTGTGIPIQPTTITAGMLGTDAVPSMAETSQVTAAAADISIDPPEEPTEAPQNPEEATAIVYASVAQMPTAAEDTAVGPSESSTSTAPPEYALEGLEITTVFGETAEVPVMQSEEPNEAPQETTEADDLAFTLVPTAMEDVPQSQSSGSSAPPEYPIEEADMTIGADEATEGPTMDQTDPLGQNEGPTEATANDYDGTGEASQTESFPSENASPAQKDQEYPTSEGSGSGSGGSPENSFYGDYGDMAWPPPGEGSGGYGSFYEYDGPGAWPPPDGEEDFGDPEAAFDEEMESFNFLTNISAADQENFVVLLSKGSSIDLTDIVELVQFSHEDFDKYGYNISESVLECTNDRKNCGPVHFRKTYSRRYGNCMTFNSMFHANATVRRTRKSGSRYGLRLTFNIQAAEYVGLLASEYGVRVSVHPPNVSPEPEDDGFVAQPGKLTSVAVRQKVVQRLAYPFASACMRELPEQLRDFVADESVYTIRQCEVSCLDFFLHKHCGCLDQTHAYGRLSKVRRCEIFKDADRSCRAMVISRDSLPFDHINSTACDCRPQCDEVSYDTTLSSTDWPTDSYMKLKILNFIGQHKVADMFLQDQIYQANMSAELDDDSDDDYYDTDVHTSSKRKDKLLELKNSVTKNLARIHVYYESKTYEVIIEEPAYPLSNLFADVGGSMGLYLGISVVTIIELFQFVGMLFLICCWNSGGKGAPPQDTLYPRKFSQYPQAPGVAKI